MDRSRYLACLAADFARLRATALTDLGARVPTCPEWTVADLTGHVGEVYLHKTECMRLGVEPQPWPPARLADEEPLALLDRAYSGLVEEFATRKPEDAAGCWYAPDPTVGFWIRRMAQETVIHRIDAELATGHPVASVPPDLAEDGIDELLKIFVAYEVRTWPKSFTSVLASSPGWSFTLRADGQAWRVRTGPGTFEVDDGAGSAPSDVTISGPSEALLRWVWNREDVAASGLTLDGPAEAVTELKRCIVAGTQ